MDKNNIYNDINNSESKQALLESDSPGDYLSKGKTQKENQNNTIDPTAHKQHFINLSEK